MRWLLLLQRWIGYLTEYIGRALSWLVLALALLIFYDVGMRYLLHGGSIALQEMEWHLFSMILLLGAAYTMKHDAHVRLDVLYQSHKLGDKHRAWINLLGTLLLFMPYVCVLILSSLPFVSQSFLVGEKSADPGGLSHRWLIKACIPLGFGLLLLQGVAEIIRNIQILLKGKA